MRARCCHRMTASNRDLNGGWWCADTVAGQLSCSSDLGPREVVGIPTMQLGPRDVSLVTERSTTRDGIAARSDF